MKKTSITAVLMAVILTFTALNCFAYDTTAHNWYVVNNNEHRQPTPDKPLAFIDKYDGYYANTNVKNDDKVVYLTFDAGYENGNVAKILDALKKHEAEGAFFILENIVKRDPDVVKRMGDEGHLVCNHTQNHPDMTKITDREMFDKQLVTLEKTYKEVTGRDLAKVFRPPEGRFSELSMSYAKELGFKTVFWSFAYADWDNNKQPDPDKAIEKIMAHTHNGEVMLLHPTSATNAAIMDDLLTRLENEGYRFGSLEELWNP